MKGVINKYGAAIGSNFIFGSSYAVVKYITPGFIHPFALNLVRVGTSISLFWILFLFKKGDQKIDKKDIPRFLLCALTGVVINQLLFIKGLSLTSAIHSSLLSLATPILITIIAALLLKEGFSYLKLGGLIMGISGAAVLILSKDQSQQGSHVLVGDILVLINASSYAFYLVLVRPLMTKYSPIQVLRWVFTFGTIGIIPFGLPPFLETNWITFDISHFIALAYVAIVGTFVAYLLTVYSISTIGPSRTGAFIYTQPIFAAVIATIFAGEHFSLIKGLAALLIFGGVFLANFKREKTTAV
ncbi:MAG: DMT family transporter [Chitinophagaceae bacterium]|nr:DMT family transporter [Chitinophagaceae bacterium]